MGYEYKLLTHELPSSISDYVNIYIPADTVAVADATEEPSEIVTTTESSLEATASGTSDVTMKDLYDVLFAINTNLTYIICFIIVAAVAVVVSFICKRVNKYTKFG